MSLRRSVTAFGVASNGEGFSRLNLPKLLNQLIIPKLLIFSATSAAPDDVATHFMGLTHDVNRTIGGLATLLSDPQIWVHAILNGHESKIISLEEFALELGGTQGITIRNESANSHDYRIDMLFDTKTTDTVHWGDVVQATSYESD